MEKARKKKMSKEYIQKEYGWMVGKTIKVVRPLNKVELDVYQWSGSEVPFAVIFTDGSWVIPMSDDEGNGAGALDYMDRWS
jgi:hypothetical protein